ncbi:MAG: site-specific DNA-methyltransferase [Chloroflexi bacterium]|nr:site-specific DNA-methyltransferase [Chloroflexota bacterium]
MADPPAEPAVNRLIHGDNLHVMRSLPDSSIDLIYIDPPFFTGRTQGSADGAGAFGDTWDGDILRYLDWLTPRLAEMRRLLTPAGSIYVHLDWHAVHYVKVEMDRLFGADCFLNDIAWLYGLGGSSARYWPRKHDRLLWYSRTSNGHWFEAVRVPARSRRMQGRTKKAPDWWDIPSLNNMSSERLGYPTQKPEALLERIIASSCPSDGLVADFFVGSGTTPAVAARLGRRWLACDSSREAIDLTAERLNRRQHPCTIEWQGE